MITLQRIIPACWIIFFLYWTISARSVKPTQETKGALGGNWYPILLLIGALFLINPRFLARLGIDSLAIPLIPHNAVIDALSVILAVAGLIVAIIARRTLAENWSAAVALKMGHELITTGIYQYVRHPIYTGTLLMVAGTMLSLGTLSAVIGFALIVIAVWLKLREEEALLTKHFSEAYVTYKRHTKTLIPFIW